MGGVIICRRGVHQPECATPECHRRAPYLCDYPLAGGKTCDRPICEGHRAHVGPNKDYCPPHARLRAGEKE